MAFSSDTALMAVACVDAASAYISRSTLQQAAASGSSANTAATFASPQSVGVTLRSFTTSCNTSR